MKHKFIGCILLFLLVIPFTLSSYTFSDKDKLMYAIGYIESRHNPKVVSKKGAIGVYQIRPCVWEKELKKEGIITHRKDLFNPLINKKAAEYILTKYHKQTNNMNIALVKYSGGDKTYPKRVRQVIGEHFTK